MNRAAHASARHGELRAGVMRIAMYRRRRVAMLLVAFSALLLPLVARAASPNLIFCLVDDWGYNDVGYHNVSSAQSIRSVACACPPNSM
eukprot:COSAG02_NODE_373_length_23594_cov_6.892190_12_plen_89_part_00